MAKACSIDCAIQESKGAAQKRADKAAKELAKRERAEHKKAKEKVKTRSEWMKEAQAAFNSYIRARDKNKGCVSCGCSLIGRKFDAGHYRSVGGHPELRFEEKNCSGQCVPCNQHRSGNLIDYRLGLIEREGQDIVDFLEGPHEPKKYTIDDLKDIKRQYKKAAAVLND